jgi:hypothetical protein
MKKKVKVINRDVVVFAFFLLLSFSLWYLNSLGDEIEAGIRYPVEFINLPNKRTITENSPDKLNLYLKGPGYSILKLKVTGDKTPLIIDLSKVVYKRIPDRKTPDYYIISSGLMKSLTVQLRSGCEVISVKPDTIFFTLGIVPEKSLQRKSESGAVITKRKGS